MSYERFDEVVGEALVRGESPEAALDALTREPLCEECGHLVSRHHAENGCESERTRQIEGSSETESGPCGCTAVTVEFEEGLRVSRA